MATAVARRKKNERALLFLSEVFHGEVFLSVVLFGKLTSGSFLPARTAYGHREVGIRDDAFPP
jgi:hypothetical protein